MMGSYYIQNIQRYRRTDEILNLKQMRTLKIITNVPRISVNVINKTLRKGYTDKEIKCRTTALKKYKHLNGL